MKNENQVQKKTGSNVLIAVLILIMLATSAFGIFAWARYQTSVQGESTAQVAKWNFKVTGNGTQTEQISFLITRTDNNTTVEEGTIAPGTYGEIPIEIDVTGTQTDLVYTISGSTVNIPRNLNLYSDSARTQELVVVGKQFSKGNYLKVADIGEGTKVINETIYWEWPFETGDTDWVIDKNNEMDTYDMGKTMTMALTVEGRQLNGAPVLADLVEVGDYVNYDANSGDNGIQTFTSEDCVNLLSADASSAITISDTISTNSEFKNNPEEGNSPSQWRVLSINRQTKEVKLISVDSTQQTIKMSGSKAFVNAEIVLDSIGAIYGEGKGAKGARSLKLEDISQYAKNEFKTNSARVPIDYESGNFLKQVLGENDKVIGYETELTQATPENPVRMIYTYMHAYDDNGKFQFDNSKIYNMLFEHSNSVYVSSRCAEVTPTGCSYRIYFANARGILGNYVFTNHGDVREISYGLMPVVELKDNIQTTGKDANGVWQLK